MTRARVLQDMALFVEVAKRKSFSQASLALEMSVSSLSRRITQLEESIGIRLLDRTTRKVALTLYGDAFYMQAIRLVEEAQRAYDDVTADAKGPAGLLKIAAPPHAWILNHFSKMISEYRADNKNVMMQIDLNHGLADLINDRYDLAFMLETPRETTLIVRKVFQIENGIFGSPAYLNEWGHPRAPSDLMDHQVIVPGQGVTWSLTHGGETASVAVSGPIFSNSPTLTNGLAVGGHGLFACAVSDVRQDVESGALIQVMPAWKLQETPVYIVTTSRLLPARTRSFIEFASYRFAAIADID